MQLVIPPIRFTNSQSNQRSRNDFLARFVSPAPSHRSSELVHSFLVNRVIEAVEAVSGSAISQLIWWPSPSSSIKLLIVAADINAGVILTTPEFMIMSLIQ